MKEENNIKINSYLSFKLGEEEFAAHASKVLNILEMTSITAVPRSPEYMKGVINLRGTVLPVIDTRIKFGMDPTVYTSNTCIIVLDILIDGETIHVGAIVDGVQAVLEIEKENIMPAPSIGSKFKSEFIIGVANINEHFIMILDMDAIFSADDLAKMIDKTNETKDSKVIEAVA